MPAAIGARLPSPANQLLVQAACNAIRDGHSLRATGPLCGVSRETFRSWLERGRIDLEAIERNGGTVEAGSHAAFAAAIESAYADFEVENLTYVRGARSTKGNGWIPAMALLRSRNPEEWVEKPDRGTTINIGTVQVVNVSAELGPAGLRTLAAIALESAAELEGRGALLLPEGGSPPTTTPPTPTDAP